MIILLLLVTFKLIFIAFPATALAGAREGLLLWFNSVLPALLPFIIIINMLVALGFARFIGGFLSGFMGKIFRLPGQSGLAFIIGLTSGYPIGAKTIASLHKQNEIDRKQAQQLLGFCNNAGPIFILSVVGAGFFANATIGYILWIGHVVGAVMVGILLRGEKRDIVPNRNKTKLHIDTNTMGEHFGAAVENGMKSILVIGGVIIFFSSIIKVLEDIGLPENGVTAGLISGLFEATHGLRDVSTAGVGLWPLAAASFLLAFGGLSIHMQTLHFIAGIGVKYSYYVFSKILHGVIAAVVTILLWWIVG